MISQSVSVPLFDFIVRLPTNRDTPINMLLRRFAFLATLAVVSAAPAKDSCNGKREVPRLPVNGGE